MAVSVGRLHWSLVIRRWSISGGRWSVVPSGRGGQIRSINDETVRD
ncbi:MAG: hypothetical protein AVDCRST_MAG93-4512 [uncultured Chloroflexia bacterium]|uniref:Uncharacterized protein n=1 Tax=uncultured Chloroflexia bacterium TaxID=1672391 RepID=A0A6J4K9A8_9CHLR|nr:MAG: hypothetical protein AVDCRST_MAG93-4512 [uncultured Chloroflexia bacterium]